MFEDWLNILFEAKTEQGSDGPISKRTVQQAAGHEKRAVADNLIPPSARTRTVIISERAVVSSLALPHNAELLVAKQGVLIDLFGRAATALTSVRAQTSSLPTGDGSEIACTEYKNNGVHPITVMKLLLATQLSELDVQ